MFLLRVLLIILIPLSSANADLIISDSEIEGVVRDIATPILRSADIDPSSVKFFIVSSNDLNAFVAGGQNIFITTALLTHSKEPETLVGVIAHETGHIVGGHLFLSKDEQRLANAKMIAGLLAGIVAGVATQSSDVGMGTGMGLSQAGALGYLKYSRQQESAADHAAVKLLNANNIPADGLIDFLSLLNSTERSFYGESNAYYRTHPVSSERIENLRSNIHYDPTKPNYLNKNLRARFTTAINKLEAFTMDKSRLFELTGKDLYQSAIANFRLARFDRALQDVDTLIAGSSDNPYYYELKGQIYFDKGDMTDAMKFYQKSSALRPFDELLKLNVVQVQVSLGKDLPKAISALTNMILKDNENVAAWHYLALAYGKQNKTTNQNLCLGWTALYTGDLPQAKRMLALTKKSSTELDQNLKLKLNDLDLVIQEIEKNAQ